MRAGVPYMLNAVLADGTLRGWYVPDCDEEGKARKLLSELATSQKTQVVAVERVYADHPLVAEVS